MQNTPDRLIGPVPLELLPQGIDVLQHGGKALRAQDAMTARQVSQGSAIPLMRVLSLLG